MNESLGSSPRLSSVPAPPGAVPSDVPSSTLSLPQSASALPASILSSLEEARGRISAWAGEQEALEKRMRAELEAVRAQLDHLHAELGIAHEDIAHLQRERDESLRLREVFARERDQALSEYAAEHLRREAARQELSMLAASHSQLQTAHQAALEAHREEARAHEQKRADHEREMLLHAQTQEAHAQEREAHTQEREAHAQTREAHAQTQQEHAQTQQEHAQEKRSHAQTRQAHAQEREAHQRAREAHQSEKAEREAEQARREEEERAREEDHKARELERVAAHETQQELLDRNKKLRERLLEVYGELHAKDLPSLILQVAVNLSGSECGLFVESDGDDTLAHIGLDELPDFIQEALYDWTRRVARDQEPVHENDPKKLPDGAKLVNLAALPVSLHSELKGVILVANKRDESGAAEDYSDDDTELLVAIGRHASLAMENRRLHLDLTSSFESTVAVLADAIEAKDAYTRGHCESVSQLAVNVAQRLGFEGDALQQIRYAALLHDIGKIGVPDGILLKSGKLLPEEFSIIQKHSQIGRDLIARVPALSSIAPIVMHHHERIDGTGYPNGLVGEGISLASRIICVADAFDAMTTPRPYREPVSLREAVEELKRCAGTHFDQRVVDVTAEVLSETMG